MSEALDRVVSIVDRLRSPGGCPWDRAQTHETLVKYLLEEAYETVEAIETSDLSLLREELGDLLLQVVLHARLAEEASESNRFTLDEVADDLAQKMIRRHPHVFSADGTAGADGEADPEQHSIDELNARWDELKAQEKQRESAVDGVPLNQPALSLAAKLISRAGKAGIDVGPVAVPAAPTDIGSRLLAVVSDAVAAGIDPEAALREAARAYRTAVQAAESR